MSRFGHAYTPKRTKEYERAIKEVCCGLVDEPIDKTVSVIARFYLKGKTKPDIDNLIKSLLDGIQPDLLINDNLVQRITAERIVVLDKKDERAELIIREVAV